MTDLLPRIAVLCSAPETPQGIGVSLFSSVEALLVEPAFDVLLLDLPSADA